MVTIQNLDFNDTFFQAGHLGISSCLEPLLGIANACFPVLQPVALLLVKPVSNVRSYLSRLVGSGRTTSRTKKPSLRDESSTRLGEGVESKNFRRLYDHLYPMSSMDHSSQITATNTMKGQHTHRGNENEIVLTIEFEVRSQSE